MKSPNILSYSEFGGGPPVICLHGLLGSRSNMNTVAKALSASFRVFTLDLRNHGASFHDDAMTYAAMVSDLITFMDARNIQTAAVVGHSMGGKCAMQAALNFPERISKLVVADIAPKAYAPWWENEVKAMLAVDLTAVAKRADADQMLKTAIPDWMFRQFLLQNLEFTAEKKYRWRSNLRVLLKAQHDISAAVDGAPFTGDALFIKGGKSSYIQDRDHVLIRRLFPRAQLKTIADAGHLAHIEATEIFVKLLTDFLM